MIFLLKYKHHPEKDKLLKTVSEGLIYGEGLQRLRLFSLKRQSLR